MSYKEKPRWTKSQEKFLKDNYEVLNDLEISMTIGRSLKSIRRKRARMGLEKREGRPKS